MRSVRHILLPLLCLLAVACREVPTYDVGAAPKGDSLRESMIRANRIIAQSEAQQIDSYLERRGWKKDRIDGGVWVAEYANSEVPMGAALGYEDTVALRYRVETLGGEELYGWRRDTVVVGRLQPTRGLDVALRTLHRGTMARVIVPSEMAYGVVGDGDRIRSRMVLVYQVETGID